MEDRRTSQFKRVLPRIIHLRLVKLQNNFVKLPICNKVYFNEYFYIFT